MRAILYVSALAIALVGCEARQPATESTGSQVNTPETKKVTLPSPAAAKKTETPTNQTKAAPQKPKLGPKATAESYELHEGCKIVSGTVLRIMRFGSFKGALKAEKPPKALKLVLEGTSVDGYWPEIVVHLYNWKVRKWEPQETFVVKGEMTKRFAINIPEPGLHTFMISYNATSPKGGNVRPNVYVKSAELEF
ncbi:MAG: hypothetical protein KatS3mg130_0753 [Candidatus Sumerlaea sp.]|nr:MAG: hypothetical protein KatS3mg130_0753 [Candidatus Sumerlaea sp.]